MTTIRALLDRFLPRGALVLSILSFAYFAMGLVRNRVFAQTFGAGAELDAYNAAIRVPEIALDVLVAAGLTAPFVPIFSALRREDEARANQFGRTVLTAATLVMAVALVLLWEDCPLPRPGGERPSTAPLRVDRPQRAPGRDGGRCRPAILRCAGGHQCCRNRCDCGCLQNPGGNRPCGSRERDRSIRQAQGNRPAAGARCC